jgi:hypothetical protein
MLKWLTIKIQHRSLGIKFKTETSEPTPVRYSRGCGIES